MKLLFGMGQYSDELTWDRVADQFPGFEIATCEPGEISANLDGVDVLSAFSGDAAMFRDHPQLSLLHQFGVGLDRIDIDAATECGVWVARIPATGSGNGESVAELAILFMLYLAKRVPQALEALKERRWDQPVGQSLLGKSACILGAGEIGSLIAERLKPFGMKLIGVRANPKNPRPTDAMFDSMYASGELLEAVSTADFVVLSINYNASMRNMIDVSVISAMKKGAVVINIARGGLLDQDALYQALLSGNLGGAGLDVFWEEPVDPDHPLLKLPNVIATPHIGGVTDTHFWLGAKVLGENLGRYARGEAFDDLVNRPPKPRYSLSSAKAG